MLMSATSRDEQQPLIAQETLYSKIPETTQKLSKKTKSISRIKDIRCSKLLKGFAVLGRILSVY
jgi:hypothetical protein